MSTIGDRVVAIINAAGGEVVGKTRLQKIVYLVQESRDSIGFDFEYHHYGPYSAELSDNISMALIFDEVNEDVRRRMSDGVPYSVFSSKSETSSLYRDFVKESSDLIKSLRDENSTVLELAATIHWLNHKEGFSGDQLWEELKVRKGPKVNPGNISEAKRVLEYAGLGIT